MNKRRSCGQRQAVLAAVLIGCVLAIAGAAFAAVQAGEMAPDFRLTLLNGNEISLKQFKGKPILIDFWSSS